MITRRDVLVATVSVFTAVAVMAFAQAAARPVMHSTFFNWADLKSAPTKTGERRAVFDAPTPTLANLECHITTLNPGESPHLPHRHADEELMIVKEGTTPRCKATRPTSSRRAELFLKRPMNCTA